MLGHAVHPEEPLMMVGLDSRGGMELRRVLADALGMQASRRAVQSGRQMPNTCTLVAAHLLQT